MTVIRHVTQARDLTRILPSDLGLHLFPTTMSFARLSPIVARCPYATLSGLSQTARPWAEKLSTEWKGTHATGGNTKNYIGGEFVESKATVWHDVVDPVGSYPPSLLLRELIRCSVDSDFAHSRARNHHHRV